MSIQLKYRIIFCLLALVCQSVAATATEKSHKSLSQRFLKPVYHKLHQIWTEGDTDVYFSGYAWHNRFTYSPERIRTYNEAAFGGGFGRGLFDAKGNWRGLYAIAFLDSHRHLEPAAGYCFLKVAKLSTNLRAGIGYSVLVTSRTDLYGGIPFPGILPWGSIFYKKVALSAAYIPGAIGAGNVLFIIGRYTF